MRLGKGITGRETIMIVTQAVAALKMGFQTTLLSRFNEGKKHVQAFLYDHRVSPDLRWFTTNVGKVIYAESDRNSFHAAGATNRVIPGKQWRWPFHGNFPTLGTDQ